jgi:hypothetical protein
MLYLSFFTGTAPSFLGGGAFYKLAMRYRLGMGGVVVWCVAVSWQSVFIYAVE